MYHSGIREYYTDGNVIGYGEDWCIVVSCGGMWELCGVSGPLAM